MKVSLVLKKGPKSTVEECDEQALRQKVETLIEEARRLNCEGIALTAVLYGQRKTAA